MLFESMTRRDHILDAADELLRHYGRQKTTIADIARAAGVAVGSVYLEFETKDALVAALSERYYAAMFREMQRAAGASGSYLERLKKVLALRLRAQQRETKRGPHADDLFACSCDATQRVRAQYGERESDLVAALLQQGIAAQEFAACDVKRRARLVLRIYTTVINPRARAELNELEALLAGGLLARK
jgi:AcrR family transcriptional regulator